MPIPVHWLSLDRFSMSSPAVVSPQDQSVTFVELFFDLVFVFSVTQIAALFHGHITWALNAANTDHSHIRLGTLAATAVAFSSS